MQPQHNPFQSPHAQQEGRALAGGDHFEIGPAFSDAWQAGSENVAALITASLVLIAASFFFGIPSLGVVFPALFFGFYHVLFRVYDNRPVESYLAGFANFGVALFGFIGTGIVTVLPGQILILASLGRQDSLGVLLYATGNLIAAYLGARFLFAPLMVVDQRIGPLDALKRSWSATRGQFWKSLITQLLVGLVTTAGIFLLGYGMLFTFPLAVLIPIAAYRQMFPATEASSSGGLAPPTQPAAAQPPPVTAPPPAAGGGFDPYA